MKILFNWFAIIIALLSFNQGILAQAPAEVRIGKYLWMTSNLDVSTFRNGDSIMEVKTAEDWVKVAAEGTPAWCYRFDNNDDWTDLWLEKYKGYGKLYNWHAVRDKRGLALAGYSTEFTYWEDLITFAGGPGEAGKKLRNETKWNLVEATNETGFNALPAGMVNEEGTAGSSGYYGYWWASTSYTSLFAITPKADMKNDSCVLARSFTKPMDKYGFSVRCVREDAYRSVSWGSSKHYLVKALPDKMNNIWLSDQDGHISRYNTETKKLDYDWTEELKTGVIHDFDIDDNGIVWAGTYKGLASFDGEKWTRYKKTEKQEIYYVAAGSGGNVWYTTGDGFYCFDGKETRKITGEYDSEVARRPVVADKDGVAWILGDSKRLYYYNSQQLIYTTGPDAGGLEYPKIFLDKDENIWITSQTKSATYGLHKYTGRGRASAGDWQHYFEGDDVTSIYVDHLDNLWVSTSTGTYKNFRKRTETCKGGLIVQDRDLNIWHIDSWSGEMKLLEVYQSH